MKTDKAAHKRPGKAIEKTIAKLKERNKELNCLYTVSRIIQRQQHSLEETLQQVVDILPLAWQDPEHTCARIVFENQAFKSNHFSKTPWHQCCSLQVKGAFAGSIEMYRLEKGLERSNAPFLKEEKELLEVVAGNLGKMIERRRTEEALQKSEQRFRNLVENSIAGISIVQNNRIIYQNREQEKLLGPLPRKYILGDFENIHPNDVDAVMQASRDIQMGKIPNSDLEFRLFPASDAGDKRAIKRVFCRVIFIDYQGKESILVNMVDMTKIMELEELLFMQDKMASLGRVAAGIAHEIRNPLSGINIYLNTLENLIDRPDSRPKVGQIISQLQSASRKIESVIKKVMDFAKPGEPKFALTRINTSVEDALSLTAVTLRKSGIEIEKDFADNIPVCYADSHFIEEAVLNLVNNAAEAMHQMESGKKISVITRVKGEHVFIEVSDSGPGVPIDLRNKVFDPFFTTKNDGTGIGLSLCHRVARDHQGVLTVGEGALGGAAFRLEIPIRKELLPGD
jgi:PAS domain S-box-containing protein